MSMNREKSIIFVLIVCKKWEIYHNDFCSTKKLYLICTKTISMEIKLVLKLFCGTNDFSREFSAQ